MKMYINNNYEAEESHNRTCQYKLNSILKAMVKMEEYNESEKSMTQNINGS